MYRQTGFAAGAEPPPPGPAEVPGSPGVPGFGGVVTLIVQVPVLGSGAWPGGQEIGGAAIAVDAEASTTPKTNTAVAITRRMADPSACLL